MKIQSNVSDKFDQFFTTMLPPVMGEGRTPRTLSAVIPAAIVELAKSKGIEVPEELITEAHEAMQRKPGPKPKKQTSFIDDGPGVWIASSRIESGQVKLEYGGAALDLINCWNRQNAALIAYLSNWGAIPEDKDGVTGMRFIPPGAPLVAEKPKHKPLTSAQVGVWVSESMVQKESLAITAEGKLVPYDAEKVEARARLQKAIEFDHAKLPELIPEKQDTPQRRAEMLQAATDKSMRRACADAVDLGWTVRLEIRKDERGRRFVPPGVKLKYELGGGNEVDVA